MSKSNTDSLVGVYGDNLNSDLLRITQKLKNKCREYFRLAPHTPLENIRYNNLKAIFSNIMDEINNIFSTKKHNFKPSNI